MRYAVLLYQDERVWAAADAEERRRYLADHEAFGEAARTFGGEGLVGVASATTLRRADDGSVLLTDGPFAETAEQLGGFYLVEAADLDEVLELCRLLPAAYTLEVRPIAEITGAEDFLGA